jgi:hypothetical protein
MAGRPKTRAKRAAERRAAEQVAPPEPKAEPEVEAEEEQHPQAKPGSPEWAEYMAERRRQRREERERDREKGLIPEPTDGAETPEERDERKALNLLRAQMASKDEKISQTAAIKLLEHRRIGKRGESGEEVEAIVYETSFAPEAYPLLVELAKAESEREVVPA